MGQRLIDGAAKSMAEDFFKRFDEAMQLRHPEAYAAQAQADAAAGAVTAPAAQPSAGLLGVPVWVWIAGAVALVAAIALLR